MIQIKEGRRVVVIFLSGMGCLIFFFCLCSPQPDSTPTAVCSSLGIEEYVGPSLPCHQKQPPPSLPRRATYTMFSQSLPFTHGIESTITQPKRSPIHTTLFSSLLLSFPPENTQGITFTTQHRTSSFFFYPSTDFDNQHRTSVLASLHPRCTIAVLNLENHTSAEWMVQPLTPCTADNTIAEH